MIKPSRLQPGMTIGVIAPASAGDPLKIDKGIAGLERYGYRVKEGKSLRGRYGYLASSDAERVADIHRMFADKKVDAIMCMRGGYGTPRLVPYLDFDLIRKNPKIFLGFSDVTMLHLAIWKKCKLVTFNGPMMVFTFAADPWREFTISGFERTLTTTEPPGSVWQHHPDRWVRVVKGGRAAGRLTGGNLSLVAATLGTPYEIDTRGKILFLEDIEETPYRIDRMLTQLLLAGKLQQAAGIVVGRNVPDKETAELEERLLREGKLRGPAVGPPRKVAADYTQCTDETIADRLGKLGIPVMIGLPFGHITDYATLPIGVKATMDTRSGDLVIEEAAVR